MTDVGILRKRVKSVMEQVRRDQGERRGRVAEATKIYADFLNQAAVPAFRAMANVLKAEGVPFEVMTPSGGVRMVPDRHRHDALEL